MYLNTFTFVVNKLQTSIFSST